MEFLKGLPAEYVPLALVLATLFLVIYGIKVLYPILKKKDIEKKEKGNDCILHSSVAEKIKDHGKWLDDNERRIVVLERSVSVMEEHNKRTDQRLDKLEQAVTDLTELVLPMSVEVKNIDKQVGEIHKKLDTFLTKL